MTQETSQQVGAFRFTPHRWLLLVYKLACMGPVDQMIPGLTMGPVFTCMQACTQTVAKHEHGSVNLRQQFRRQALALWVLCPQTLVRYQPNVPLKSRPRCVTLPKI